MTVSAKESRLCSAETSYERCGHYEVQHVAPSKNNCSELIKKCELIFLSKHHIFYQAASNKTLFLAVKIFNKNMFDFSIVGYPTSVKSRTYMKERLNKIQAKAAEVGSQS